MASVACVHACFYPDLVCSASGSLLAVTTTRGVTPLPLPPPSGPSPAAASPDWWGRTRPPSPSPGTR
eukprot:2006907-Pyramimonas_sp.AAC.3